MAKKETHKETSEAPQREIKRIGDNFDWDSFINENKPSDAVAEIFKKYYAIVISCELKVDNKQCTDFYGIEIGMKLRMHNITIPIIFESFLPLSYFQKHKPDLSEILICTGSCFQQLPHSEDLLEILKKEELINADDTPVQLDNMDLFDIQSTCCGKTVFFNNIIHQLNNL